MSAIIYNLTHWELLRVPSGLSDTASITSKDWEEEVSLILLSFALRPP